jgi:hypothetical protein
MERWGVDKKTNFLRNCCLPEIRPEKKFLKLVKKFQGKAGQVGSAKIQTRYIFCGGFP